jgi:hypothetical protein
MDFDKIEQQWISIQSSFTEIVKDMAHLPDTPKDFISATNRLCEALDSQIESIIELQKQLLPLNKARYFFEVNTTLSAWPRYQLIFFAAPAFEDYLKINKFFLELPKYRLAPPVLQKHLSLDASQGINKQLHLLNKSRLNHQKMTKILSYDWVGVVSGIAIIALGSVLAPSWVFFLGGALLSLLSSQGVIWLRDKLSERYYRTLAASFKFVHPTITGVFINIRNSIPTIVDGTIKFPST